MISEWIKHSGEYFGMLYVAINALVFLIYGMDKWKAVHNRWRISEAALMGAAVFGGIGALLGMFILHHKTRKPKFYIGVPAILILEIAVIALIYYLA